ncbi:hypothetical protein IR083_04040 [Dysgonomonas sp. GY75]|uniref:hypothetical protein n=1 Tax=Dysgonomonas sp. GY75 TaxID=2780419 RepID=UPI001883B9E3|nr:hypothetical protein [Dysgonomonas sp. GY75]MBF0647984.1 hypothetical protein [Dysgonomonas sp. GY75]
MLTVFIVAVLLYVVCVTSYVLWTNMKREQRSRRHNPQPTSHVQPPPNDIIGKSTFKLPVQSITEPSSAKTEPLDAKPEGNEKEAENSNNFVSSKSEGSVPEDQAEQEDNPPLSIDVPLEYERIESEDLEEEEEVEGLRGASIASGMTFEDMGQAVTVVVHYQEATPEECLQAGKSLSRLENTELFEKLASSAPERRDIITELMDFHMKDYLAGIAGKKNRKPKAVPDGFDINDLVQQIKK